MSGVRIRLAQPSDAAAIADIYRPFVDDTAISFETVAPDAAEIARRLADTLPHYPWLVCETGEQVTGYAYASRHRVREAYRWSVDASVYVATGHRGCGVGRALYDSLFAILSAQGFYNAYAGITLPNAASVRLHEAAGFELVGVYRRVGYKLGAWHDVGWWQLMLRQYVSPPDEPIDLAALQRDPGWPALLARGQARIRTAS